MLECDMGKKREAPHLEINDLYKEIYKKEIHTSFS